MKYLVSIIVAAIVLTAVTYYHHESGNLSTTFAGFLGAMSFFITISIYNSIEKKNKSEKNI